MDTQELDFDMSELLGYRTWLDAMSSEGRHALLY